MVIWADTLLNYMIQTHFFFYFWFTLLCYNGSPRNVLPCFDVHNPESACIQKPNRIFYVLSSLKSIDLKWSDPSLDPAQAGATCTRLPFLSSLKSCACPIRIRFGGIAFVCHLVDFRLQASCSYFRFYVQILGVT
ncbi:unnamed protein product [Triticum turgidum subsp. durum]|uniref:Uncharacterized protein n=1 Tax=Triticum turgidum subsp. durum TaxID=4567 RepID=A0A9R0VVQ8_TRITD|nr:unnamed protein product [Triticum turgidum subsp. durum]